MTEHRRWLGEFGEALASWYLSDQGLRMVGSNASVDGGEIDLLAVDGDARVAVEVRTTTSRVDPIDAVDEGKRRHVTRLARRTGADRVDLIGISVDALGIDVHWVPGVS